jgi:glutathione S-transferase
MKIYFSPASPFVRKCLVVANEVGLVDRIEKLPSAAHPINRDPIIASSNPLGQVPTFFTDDGQAIHDSRVICEYLNSLAGADLFPADTQVRWQVLTEQSLADGILDAALLARYELAVRPESLQWGDWAQSQMGKIAGALDYFESVIGERGDKVDIGTITLGCALGYLGFRFADYDWQGARPALAAWFEKFNQRPSMLQTLPHV